MKFVRLIVVFSILVSFTALAGKPDKYVVYEGPDFFELVDCGDFSIWDDAWIYWENKDFYDANGNYVRTQIRLYGFDNLFSDADPDGLQLSGSAHLNARFAFDEYGDPIWTQQGLAIAITVPGYGPLFFDAGRLVWNEATGDLLFEAGRRHDWNFGEFEALCSYFDQD